MSRTMERIMADKTGLGAFTSRQQEEAPEEPTRKRGQGSKVSIPVRLTRRQWERLHQVAIAEGDSLQTVIVGALRLMFQERGLGEF